MTRQDLLDELLVERHRPVPPPPGQYKNPSDRADFFESESLRLRSERDRLRVKIEELWDRVQQLEAAAIAHRCQPYLKRPA